MSHPYIQPNTNSANAATSRNRSTDELIATYPFQTPNDVESVPSALRIGLRPRGEFTNAQAVWAKDMD